MVQVDTAQFDSSSIPRVSTPPGILAQLHCYPNCVATNIYEQGMKADASSLKASKPTYA